MKKQSSRESGGEQVVVVSRSLVMALVSWLKAGLLAEYVWELLVREPYCRSSNVYEKSSRRVEVIELDAANYARKRVAAKFACHGNRC